MMLFRLYRSDKWSKWFAWRPVFAESYSKYGFPCKELVWLETVERRAVFSGMDGSFGGYRYSRIPKSLN